MRLRLNVMKPGPPPGGTLAGAGPARRCRKEAGCHGARRVGPESNAAGCACDGRVGGAVGGDHGVARGGRAGSARLADRCGVRRAGVRGDRVDERRPVRARPAGAGGLAGRDRRRAEGQGAGPAGLQDRQDRLLGAGRAVAPGPGAGDLAAHPGGARRAGTGPLAAAPGAPPHRAEEPDPRHPARVRPPVPGVGPVRHRRPGAAGPAGAARARGPPTPPPRCI